MKPLILGPCDMPAVARRLGVPSAQADRLPNAGGMNITNLALALIRRGVPFDLGSLSPHAASDVDRIPAGPVTLWVARSRPSRRLRDAYRMERHRLRSVMAESDCTVVNANWTYEYGLAALKSSKPCLTTVHDCPSEILRLDGWSYLPHYLMATCVIRRAATLAAVSPHVQGYLRRVWRRDSRVVPNLLPPDLPERADTRSDAPILVLAHGAPHKNVRTAITAFQQWRRQDPAAGKTRLRLVGPGLGPGETMARWAAVRGLADRVEFVGKRTPQEALLEIASARFLLSSSLSDSWSLPIAEAMAIGTPVLAAREAGGAVYLLGDDAGMLVSGRSAADMADGIRRLVGATEGVRARTERARARIRELCGEGIVLDAFQGALAAAVPARADEDGGGKACP